MFLYNLHIRIFNIYAKLIKLKCKQIIQMECVQVPYYWQVRPPIVNCFCVSRFFSEIFNIKLLDINLVTQILNNNYLYQHRVARRV